MYNYRSFDGAFDDFEMPAKGRDLPMIERLFDDWRERAREPDAILYRTDSVTWWAPWCWGNPRWRLPYLSPETPTTSNAGRKPTWREWSESVEPSQD
jgi:hypothetical protein